MDEMSVDETTEDATLEFVPAVESWLDGLTGEDKRVRDEILYELAPHPQITYYLAERMFRESLDEVPGEESPWNVTDLAGAMLTDFIGDYLNPANSMDVVRASIVKGEDWQLSKFKRAADALGLDIQELFDEADSWHSY